MAATTFKSDETIVIFITASGEAEAAKIAHLLVEEKLAACCNIIPAIRSVYRWEGKICDDNEVLLIVKSRAELFSDIEERVRQIHSYKVPEIIALPIVQGSHPYLEWLKGQVF